MECEKISELQETEQKNVISEYNEAKFQIWRLHYSWTLCNQHRRSGSLTALKWELDTIWDELSSKAIKKNPSFEVDIDNLDKCIADAKLNKEIYTALRKKSRKLKIIQDEIGMGGKFKSEEEDDIDS